MGALGEFTRTVKLGDGLSFTEAAKLKHWWASRGSTEIKRQGRYYAVILTVELTADEKAILLTTASLREKHLKAAALVEELEASVLHQAKVRMESTEGE